MTRRVGRSTPYPLPLRERVDASEASVRVRGISKIQYARVPRARMTDAERKLWFALRDRRFANFKFRRQVPIGHYIADYVCYAARVVIEVDGSQHAESRHDARRDRWLEQNGFVVLRFWNNDVLSNLEGVLTYVLDVLLNRNPSTPSPASPAEVGFIRLRPFTVPNSGEPEFGRGSAPSPARGEGTEFSS
jgi:very-short-patch-repair endonuclease